MNVDKIIEALAKDYCEVFEKMTRTLVSDTKVHQKTRDRPLNKYQSAIEIAYQDSDREINGKLILGFSDERMAVKLATAIARPIGIPTIKQLDDAALDILSEFMNTVAGQAITSWDHLGLSADFGIPRITAGVSFDDSDSEDTSIYEVTLHFDEDSVAILVYFKVPANAFKTGKKVLVVDDSMTIRFMISKAFQEQGWEVIEAKDGLEGFIKFEQHSADLIIMDLIMPQMGGLKAISLIREIDPNVDIIILTSTAKREEVVTAASYKIKSYIKKPVQMDQLIGIASGVDSKKADNMLSTKPAF